MKHLGDIAKVHGGDIAPVDVITFGSPCQDLSVAGGQKGMKYVCPACGVEFAITAGAASQNQKPPLLLSLKAAGQTPDASLTWAAAALPGEPLTLNFTEYPNAAVGSSLSAILQDNVPDSYSLSPAACRGILRRAFVRGKPLPEPLLSALIMQANR